MAAVARWYTAAMSQPFQFRLRTLLVFVAIAAIACGLAAHAGKGGFVVLAFSTAGLSIGSAGLMATEAMRKQVRPGWMWVPLVMGVVSGTIAAWSILWLMQIVVFAIAKILFPTLID